MPSPMPADKRRPGGPTRMRVNRRRMRTHPLIALAVASAAITTVTVFGRSVPAITAIAVKPHHAKTAAARPTPIVAVPAWLVAPAASMPWGHTATAQRAAASAPAKAGRDSMAS